MKVNNEQAANEKCSLDSQIQKVDNKDQNKHAIANLLMDVRLSYHYLSAEEITSRQITSYQKYVTTFPFIPSRVHEDAKDPEGLEDSEDARAQEGGVDQQVHEDHVAPEDQEDHKGLLARKAPEDQGGSRDKEGREDHLGKGGHEDSVDRKDQG